MRVLDGLQLAVLLGLVSCGGGGGGGGSDIVAEKTSQELAQVCAKENYLSGDATTATTAGDLADEKRWVKAYMSERYLWYRDIPSVDPTAAAYNLLTTSGGLDAVYSVYEYFLALLNPQKRASGRRVDEFSFAVSTAEWNAHVQGESLDYGWKVATQGEGSTRRVWVSYVFPTTTPGTAGSNGIQRGDEIVSVDGIRADDGTHAAQFDERLTPSKPGVHTFVLLQGGRQVTKTLTAASTVFPQAEHRVLDRGGVRWGYLLFNSHIQGVEKYLLQAMDAFKAQGVTALAVDLRYNSGGYLSIANGLAYAVAGAQKAQGRVFETTRFNDKQSKENGDLLFENKTLFGEQSYATLNLSKIYVLTTEQTCSASESFINSLRGIDVEVEIIGTTTCGKPYGYYPQDNCGLTYAAMEFEGVNAKGQGGYSEGLAPTCVVSDDLTHALGNPAEALFAQAIARQQGAACTATPARMALSAAKAFRRGAGVADLVPVQAEWKKHKFLRRTP